MPTRIPNGPTPTTVSTSQTLPPTSLPPSGVPTDPRRDMQKELAATQLVTSKADVEATLKAIVTKPPDDARRGGEARPPPTPGLDAPPTSAPPKQSAVDRLTPPIAGAPSPPSSEQVQRALQNLQKEAGLPVTGRFDDATVQLLKNIGVVQGGQTGAKPADKPAEKAPEPKKPVDPAARAEARQKIESNPDAARLRARLNDALPKTANSSSSSSSKPPPTQNESKPLDRALDPARLIASLFAAGFSGPPDKALSSFQTAHGLPVTATLDAKTVETLVAQGHVSAEAADAHTEANKKSQAAGQGASTGAAKDAAKTDSTRPQAATTAATKAGDMATRAPASSPAEAREMARLESLLAQAAATERGVQEGKGDPTATAGHGENAGKSTGLSGSGGSGGGALKDGTEAAIDVVGDAGSEDSVGNSKAGDDDHDDDRRGNASDAASEDVAHDDDGTPAGHYRVVKLSEQVTAALATIARIDDDTVPVHYTWDVTLHRPGVYSDGQPAEALWHLVVERAHAFDPVWKRAQEAIASRLLYVEPDAEPLTHDEILGALRRARVR